MKITGIICEYNPFHNGHEYLIKKCSKIYSDNFAVAIMSGNFVQRGECAFLNKYLRTKMALLGGADIVFELPTVYALQSAEGFAHGGVTLLNGLSCIDNIVFGSETGNTDDLIQIAEILYENSTEIDKIIGIELQKGISYASARKKALESFSEKSDILDSSNNILAAAYIQELLKSQSKIVPFAVKRMGENYNSEVGHEAFPSASALRKQIFNNDMSKIQSGMPERCVEILNDNIDNTVKKDDFWNMLLYKLSFMTSDDLKNYDGINEGLEFKLKKSSYKSACFDELILSIKSKRYAYSRISRSLFQILLGIDKKLISYANSINCPYARLLGFKKSALSALSYIADNSKIPIISRVSDYPCNDPIFNIDLIASEIYGIAEKSKIRNRDFTTKLITI